MVIAQIRLPGGLEPRFEKLKELVKSEKIDYYEIFGAREIVLYWRGMHAKGEVEVSFDGVAVVPGTYTGRSSCVYLYYTPEHSPVKSQFVHENTIMWICDKHKFRAK